MDSVRSYDNVRIINTVTVQVDSGVDNVVCVCVCDSLYHMKEEGEGAEEAQGTGGRQ